MEHVTRQHQNCFIRGVFSTAAQDTLV